MEFREELLSEIESCREDERSSQGQILSVIAAAGAILSVIFSSSLFANSSGKSQVTVQMGEGIKNFAQGSLAQGWLQNFLVSFSEYLTYPRIGFFLSNCVCCTAIFYIVTIGVNNVMRYQYLRILEDRLRQLTPDRGPRENFVHWTNYSGLYVTRNRKHLYSPRCMTYYGGYTLAVVGGFLFCMGLMTASFAQIENLHWFDFVSLSLPIVVMACGALCFADTSHASQKMAYGMMKEAYHRQRERIQRWGIAGPKDKTIFTPEFVLYLVYPKWVDAQKAGLFVLGYIFTIFAAGNASPNLHRFLLYLFVGDFLFYQSRYMYNDLRGMTADMENEHCKFLGKIKNVREDNKPEIRKKIKTVSAAAAVRFAAAVAISAEQYFYRQNADLLLYGAALVVITFIYEHLRSAKPKQERRGILSVLLFAVVGTGYPLRFLLGSAAAMGENGLLTVLVSDGLLPLSLFIFGIYVAVKSWAIYIKWKLGQDRNSTFNRYHFAWMADKMDLMNDGGPNVIEKALHISIFLALTMLSGRMIAERSLLGAAIAIVYIGFAVVMETAKEPMDMEKIVQNIKSLAGTWKSCAFALYAFLIGKKTADYLK